MKSVMIQCSTTHLTKDDDIQLKFLSGSEVNLPWVYDATFGYIVDLGSFRHPLLEMKSRELSKSFRRFVYHMQTNHQAKYIHFDCDADEIANESAYVW